MEKYKSCSKPPSSKASNINPSSNRSLSSNIPIDRGHGPWRVICKKHCRPHSHPRKQSSHRSSSIDLHYPHPEISIYTKFIRIKSWHIPKMIIPSPSFSVADAHLDLLLPNICAAGRPCRWPRKNICIALPRWSPSHLSWWPVIFYTVDHGTGGLASGKESIHNGLFGDFPIEHGDCL